MLSGCGRSASSDAGPDSTAAPAAKRVSQAPASAPTPSAKTASGDAVADDARSVAEKLEDAVVETRVKQALMRQDQLRIFTFEPTVVRGHLELRGDVNTPEQYRQAERVVERVDGVSQVTNQLTMGGRAVTESRLKRGDDASGDGKAVYHTVRPGDTLWEIARRYKAPVEQIRSLNDLRSKSLRPGERIRIR